MVPRWLVATAVLASGLGPAAAGPPDLALSYVAETCLACHVGTSGPVPAVVGRPAAELADAMTAYRDGRRKNAIMSAAVKNLTDAEVSDLASYLAAGAGSTP